MAIDLKFSKSDRSSNWGFRVVGGADFNEPLVVVKVHKDSLAEKCGLKVGDVIKKINEHSTETLTHSEAHKLIESTGLEFKLRISRGEIIDPHLLQSSGQEVVSEKFLRDVQVAVNEEIIDTAEKLAETLGQEIFTEFGQHKLAANRQSEKKMVYSNSTQTYFATEDKYKQKKWSTFLMKPDRPMPESKQTIEQRIIMSNPYKIEIKKQSRRKSYTKEKRVQFDQNVTEVEIERKPHSPEVPISPDPDSLGYEQDTDSLEIISNNSENVGEYENEYVDQEEDYNQEEYQEEHDCDDDRGETDFHIRKDSLGVKYKPISEIIIEDPNTDNVMTLEDQLKAVQKQLEALSQLPSSVQITLDAVSKQLASIVSSNKDKEEDEEDIVEENKEEISESAEAQAEANSEDGEDSIVGDELEEDSADEEELQTIVQRENVEEEPEEDSITEGELNEINEEEIEAKRIEEEMQAKKEKEMAAPTKPGYRPIVLPGGRKWIDPDDVVPTRKPRMTDEMIMETIDSNLEIIQGKRKGINFMKNTPPPKNLDYLQRSEVYRLVHGMEPPVRGITARPEKILPEQDYYEASHANA